MVDEVNKNENLHAVCKFDTNFSSLVMCSIDGSIGKEPKE